MEPDGIRPRGSSDVGPLEEALAHGFADAEVLSEERPIAIGGCAFDKADLRPGAEQVDGERPVLVDGVTREFAGADKHADGGEGHVDVGEGVGDDLGASRDGAERILVSGGESSVGHPGADDNVFGDDGSGAGLF